MKNKSDDTPLTDIQERFFYYEVPRQSFDYYRSQRPNKSREGFVPSEFARKLERQLNVYKDKK